MTDRALHIQLDQDWLHRALVGFLVAAAFIFVEAGVAQVLLARHAACVESLSQFRLAPDPFEFCMSEFGYYLARSASHGFFGAAAPQLLVWPVLGVVYGVIGGAFAQLDLRRAVGGFALLHLLLLAVFTLIGYLSQYIV